MYLKGSYGVSQRVRNEAGVSMCVSESGKDQIFVLWSGVVRILE